MTMKLRKGLQWKSFFIYAPGKCKANKKDCNGKPDLKEGSWRERSERNDPECRLRPNFDAAQLKNVFIYSTFFAYLCSLTKHGVDWFRQQDRWVSKHAENRSAISLIPCYKILTGNQEFALAA